MVSSSSPARLASLDGLRGLAVLIVVAEHVLPWWLLQGSVIGDCLALILSMGWVGVELFFVLSGYLITGILLRTREEATYYKSFGLRRAWRILPVYALLLGFVFLALPAWEPTGDPRIDHPDPGSLWLYLSFGTNFFPCWDWSHTASCCSPGRWHWSSSSTCSGRWSAAG